MCNSEKLNLYKKAKDTYYNGGEQIMSDMEFDELEKELGLENKAYVGSKSKNYTIPHPFIMGSISKVQVKYNDEGTIDFDMYKSEVEKYLLKSIVSSHTEWGFETTPKLDGCSFECIISYSGQLLSVSTRGDGNFGKDIKNWFDTEWEKNYVPKIRNWISRLDTDSYMFLDKFVIRGEVLIDKKTFEKKYSKDFTIPRSFVSGVINKKWENTPEQIEMRNDLSFITYDYREVYENGTIIEIDYDNTLPGVCIENRKKFHKLTTDLFKFIYEDYEKYRYETCPFCLDGIVIKPFTSFRLQDNTRERQEDCVAIKFTPDIVETCVEGIEWNVGKNGEYYPIGKVKEVILDGKKINRVSLHNYDYITRNICGVGSIIEISLAGDIIPFVYKIVNHQPINLNDIPSDSYNYREKSGCVHLMKDMTNEDKQHNDFLTSVKVLKIDGISEKISDILYDIKHVSNILDLMTNENIELIKNELESQDIEFNKNKGKNKTTRDTSRENIIKSLLDKRSKLTLEEIIESCGFENCGKKNSLWLSKIISGYDVSTDGIPTSIIELSKSSEFNDRIKKYMYMFNVKFTLNEDTDKIPVIMTGEPSNTSYKTKKQWLVAHPQYKETTSWKECKILFTNDIDGNSGKMKNARKKNIEIRLYEK